MAPSAYQRRSTLSRGKNPIFKLIWHRLEVALTSRCSVLPLPSWPNSDVVDYTPDGKIVVQTRHRQGVTTIFEEAKRRCV
jgi:hypothetical protein